VTTYFDEKVVVWRRHDQVVSSGTVFHRDLVENLNGRRRDDGSKSSLLAYDFKLSYNINYIIRWIG
jgi:hypothetical protein